MAFDNQFNTNISKTQDIVKKEYIENDSSLCFDTIPIYKVIVLTLVTGGFYQVILFYSWWKRLKVDFGYKVSPFWRGLFSGISVFWLFPIFEKYFKCYKITSFNAGTYAVLFFICCWASNQLTFRNHNESIFIEIVSWLFLFGAIAVITNAQNKINTINQRYYPQAKNNNWKLSNTIWTIICSIILMLSFISQPNNYQENNIKDKSAKKEQITDTQILKEELYNNKQRAIQDLMKSDAKIFAMNLKADNIKCSLSSPGLAQCFTKGDFRGVRDISLNGNRMSYSNFIWRFTGDGICEKHGNCKIEIVYRPNVSIKVVLPIYVNDNGYISIE